MNRSKKEPGGSACYFLTFNVVDWVDIFIRPLYKLVMVDALNRYVQSNGLVINSWCLMTNHLHLIAQPKEGYSMSVILRDMKKHMTKKILEAVSAEPDMRKNWMLARFENYSQFLKRIEKYAIWQSCSNPVYISTSDVQPLIDHIRFIHENPVRDAVVEHAEDYIFSSARDYAGIKGVVDVSIISLPPTLLKHRDTLSGLLMN